MPQVDVFGLRTQERYRANAEEPLVRRVILAEVACRDCSGIGFHLRLPECPADIEAERVIGACRCRDGSPRDNRTCDRAAAHERAVS